MLFRSILFSLFTNICLFFPLRIVKFYHNGIKSSMHLYNLFKYFCLPQNIFVTIITSSSFECQDYNMSLHPQSCNEKEILSQNGTKPLFCNSVLFSYPYPIFMIHTSHEPGETSRCSSSAVPSTVLNFSETLIFCSSHA